MLSKNARKMILKTTVALTVGLTSVVAVNYKEPVMVEAAAVINETQGVVTVKASSIWTYSKADWNARTKVFSQGTKFNVLQKLGVSGREMYRLDNGLYISANPTYVSFSAAAGSTVTPPPASSQVTVKTGKTSVNLNMRTGAGTGNAIILTIPRGGSVTINSTSGGWSNVTYGGKKGWVSSQYLTGITTVSAPTQEAPEAQTPPVTAPSTTGTSKTTVNLNMRTGAGTGNAIVLTIPKSGTVTVHSTSNGWSNVTYNGKKGWVSAKYLTTVTAPAPTTPAPTTPTPAPTAPSVLGTSKTTVNLNMRTGAGTGNRIVLTIPKGGTVTVHSTSGGWSNVTYNGKKGYVSATYLTTVTPPAAPTAPAPTTPKPAPTVPGVIGTSKTTVNLNMRTGAGTGNAIVLTIPKGGAVSIYATSNGWSNVTYNGKKGWVSSKYLTTMVAVAPPVVVEPVTPPVVEEKPETEAPVVEKMPAVLLVEGLKSSYSNENISVVGRAVTMDGVTSVTATIDGKTINVERYDRPELNTLYSEGYNLEKLGYRFTLDKATLAVGKHTLVVTSKAKDGSTKKVTSTFTMTKPAPAMTINGITDGQAVPGGGVNVTGYAVNVDGVTGMKYYINGVDKGTVSYGSASTDTGSYATYTGHKNANYSFTLNGADFSSTGMNSLRVEMIGKDGTLYAKTYVIRGSETERYVAEEQTNTRDAYAILETKKSVWPKISHGGFVDATMNEIQFNIDPGNFIYDDARKYMFLDLNYDAEMNVTAGELDTILAGKGVLDQTGAAFLEAAETYNINPFYLISHAIHETGRGTSVLAKGQKVTATYEKFGDESTIHPDPIPEEDKDKLVYNVYGIGAWDVNPNLWGAQRAYDEEWFTVNEAIIGGAKWIGESYINATPKQNTLFKMRFNFPSNMNHEYATDLGWAQKQAPRIQEQIDAYMLKNPDTKLNLKFFYPKFK